MADDMAELAEGSWWCDACRHLIWAPTRSDRINHLLDAHREDLISGRLKVITAQEGSRT